ncbi:MAG: hypothetical protein OXI87_18800 [Albidovulum sp.]|nr:hypothetical protein [Albidovulum sp.]
MSIFLDGSNALASGQVNQVGLLSILQRQVQGRKATKLENIEAIAFRYAYPFDSGFGRKSLLMRGNSRDGIVGRGRTIAIWAEAGQAVAALIGESCASPVAAKDPRDAGAA